jgi:starch phosphorylase
LSSTIAEIRRDIVFTTHTPVPAGNETYDPGMLLRVLPDLARQLDTSDEEVLALGRSPDAPHEALFGMTELALHTSRCANAVSKRHGEVSRAMWQRHYRAERSEDVPIAHVTNGVHLPTWMAPPIRQLLRRFLGEDWESSQDDAQRWAKIQQIPDEELWRVRLETRKALTDAVRTHSVMDRLERGEPIDYVEAAAKSFDPNVLTVGFARRVATYKRLHLLTESPERAVGLLGGEHPIQVVIAGKAHPSDDVAKRSVQTIFAIRRAPVVGMRVAFLEDYDLEIAALMVAGCDVWVNLPRPPNEASGTSGMKAALNGGLNLSVLDGWWCEGFAGDNGWAIESAPNSDAEEQDRVDARKFYDTLEQQIVPAFYERDEHGLPRRWLQYVRNSLATIGPRFNSARMVHEYGARIYPR